MPRQPRGSQQNKPGEKPAGGKQKKEYAEVPMESLVARRITKIEKAEVIPGRERTDAQKLVDKEIRSLAFDYVAAGQPKNFFDMPVSSYTVPTEQVETIKFMVGKACSLLNCKPRWGRPTESDGNEVVTFAAIPRDPSQWTDKPEDEPVNDSGEKSGDDAGEKPADDAGEKRTDPQEFLTA